MGSLSFRSLGVAIAALGFAACSQADGDTTTTSGTPTVEGAALGVMSLGSPDAPVKIEEFASITCGHCATFHEETLPSIKARVASGDVYFEFHEFPTPPQDVAMAGFAMARCAGEDKYFDVLDDLFENQMGILSAARNGTVRIALETVAARHGLSKEDFSACLDDKAVVQSIVDIIQAGNAREVSSTPTIFFNGEKLTRQSDVEAEGLLALIDEAIGAESGTEGDGSAGE